MSDEEFNKQIDYEYECFSNWIDKKNDICSNSIMDNMSEAYMCGYEKAMKDMNVEITYNKTKDKRYLKELIRLLPNSYKVVKIMTLAEENEELKKENDILIKGLGCETCSIHLEYEKLNNQIEELKAQIEKMKGCSNCANGLRNGLLCDRQLECRKNNNKLWELAE